jgi:fused signal recognition particle receptor
MSFFSQISSLTNNVFAKIFGGGGKKDLLLDRKRTLFEIEKALLDQDFHIDLVGSLIKDIKENFEKQEIDTEKITEFLKEKFLYILKQRETTLFQSLLESEKKNVLFFTGVNGVGKTNTVAKLAFYLQKLGKKVCVVPADTFRPAAINQVMDLCNINNITCESFGKEGDKSSSVVFRAMEKLTQEKYDFILVDLCGFSYHRDDLVKEVKKTINVGKKQSPGYNHNVFTIIDSTMGQGTLKQVNIFVKGVETTGLIFTKTDIVIKPGIIFTIGESFNIPFLFCTYGGKITDIKEFSPKDFIISIF